MRRLNFKLTIDGISDDTLVVRGFHGDESISDAVDSSGNPYFGYRYHIDLASRSSSSLPAKKIIDSKALLEVIRNGKVVQKVHGVIRALDKHDTGHHHTFYSITLVPSLERLALRRNSRIFQQKNAQDIISIILGEMGISDFCFDLKRTPAVREYCVQYRENDLAFFHRLAAEEGMMYMFTHEDSKHMLVITDHDKGFPKLGGKAPYNCLSGGANPDGYISSMTERKRSEVSSIEMRDYSFKKPDYNFSQKEDGTAMDYQEEMYEHFDFPGRFKDDGNGKAFNKIRLEYLRRAAHTVTGKSDETKIQAGQRFEVKEHDDDAMNRLWLAVQVSHTGSQPQALEEDSAGGATDYSNQFTLIPGDSVWRAHPQPKPRVDGPSIALVVGPPGEEIYTDEHGRVKLHFPWDRYDGSDDKSSAWIRVSQGWAGGQQGMVTVPRIGNEVIVSFLHGDPDQPIVTGRTYDASNTPPYALPANKTKTVLRTQTHQGKGYNELSFEDQSGSEKIYLHAQKDVETLIENDSTTDIKHDRHETIENNQSGNVKKADHLVIEGEQRIKITKNRTVSVDKAFHQKVAGKQTLDAGSEVHLKGGNSVVLQAGSEITIKVGGSFVKLDPGGVSVVGPAINLNSGGSAGSGSGYGGEDAVMPKILEALEPPEELVPPDITGMTGAEAVIVDYVEKPKPKTKLNTPKRSVDVPKQIATMKSAAKQGQGICQICKKQAEANS
ncbi:Phage-related baseplate assembly protein [Vibrio aerogenes CECT 7868]|uniref:Phage-related baseplate assembly protein n=1 Tax=Vibrio aerogenes CECT 7868 TaxID=1216006 RepID=A0A1M6DCV2_9VIBR|nr:type VI secretion system tip protein TssI/VgrG [Vibrio aerogenes]SHI71114.1 Phage-related baseplate assembly protein [Vibrio aerogenes CECT 7868]